MTADLIESTERAPGLPRPAQPDHCAATVDQLLAKLGIFATGELADVGFLMRLAYREGYCQAIREDYQRGAGR